MNSALVDSLLENYDYMVSTGPNATRCEAERIKKKEEKMKKKEKKDAKRKVEAEILAQLIKKQKPPGGSQGSSVQLEVVQHHFASRSGMPVKGELVTPASLLHKKKVSHAPQSQRGAISTLEVESEDMRRKKIKDR